MLRRGLIMCGCRVQTSVLAKLPGGVLTWDALAELPYATAVCHETLRLMPPVPMTFRETAEPVTVTTSQGQQVPLPKVVKCRRGAVK
jgi:cytochrome P450